jgi:hypothetical protein
LVEVERRSRCEDAGGDVVADRLRQALESHALERAHEEPENEQSGTRGDDEVHGRLRFFGLDSGVGLGNRPE